MPVYRPFGSEATLTPPGRFDRTRFYWFALHADRERLDAVCARYLNLDPTGRLRYRPLGPTVLLAFTDVPSLVSADPSKGSIRYRDIALWVPVVAHEVGKPPRLRLFPPYIFVDDATTMVTGREVFGLPKQLGRFEMPEDPLAPGPFTADVVGCAHPGEERAWHRLFAVEATRAAHAITGASVDAVVHLLGRAQNSLPAVALGTRLDQLGAVGLKQLRDEKGGDEAVYQAIVEAALIPTTVYQAVPLPWAWRFTLSPLASHPIAAELGLSDGPQDVTAALYVEADVTMPPGEVVWSAAGSIPAPKAEKRRKVAVLGGGIGGLTAALELTRTPERRAEHEVTVYLPGWRLGGKGASGRNSDAGNRIEEHGLHVWFGCYENAFRLIREAYSETGRDWRTAFTPQHEITLFERHEDRWVRWSLRLPPTHGTPGDGAPPDVFSLLGHLLGWIEGHVGELLTASQLTGIAGGHPHLQEALHAAGHLVGRVREHAAHHVGPLAHRLEAVASAAVALRDRYPRLGHGAYDDGVRRSWLLLDTFAAIVRGIAHDRLFEPPGFSRIDHLDFREWLVSHGAHPSTVADSPSVRFVYNAAFAFEGGDVRNPRFAAGVALRCVLRMLGTYKEAVLFRMNAGMGDVVFAPIYEALRQRGVRFRFFHEVEDVGLDATGTSVERVAIAVQARLRDGLDEYPPLVDLGGMKCWPSKPIAANLVDGDGLLASRIDLEDPGSRWTPSRRTLVAGRDFDAVVLAIPPAVLPTIASELVARSPAWARMLATTGTTATQAWQLWLTKTAEELGWPASRERVVSGTFVDPVDTWCDMSHLIPREELEDVRSIAYFCGVLDDRRGESRADADARVRSDALAYVEHDAPTLWPKLRAPAHARATDWTALVDPSKREGRSRFGFQYTRANTRPSERYTLSLPGSIEHRLRPGESGFDRLYLAGDWTRNGLDVGCIEATVMSGLQAASAILGERIAIPGDHDDWLWASSRNHAEAFGSQ